MKNLFSILALIFCPIFTLAQIPKYGSVKPEEFNLRPTTPADSSADVYVLYHTSESKFKMKSKKVYLETVVKKRFLVLTDDGKDYANISLSYLYKSNDVNSENETLFDIEAASYNLVDGKIEKKSMPGKFIFTEQVENDVRMKRFAVPNVRVGTIVEYTYKLHNPRYWDIPNWYAQLQYPVKNAYCVITSPGYFIFKHYVQGYGKLSANLDNVHVNDFYDDGASVTGFKVTCSGHDIVAMVDEPYVSNPRIYQSRMEYELVGIEIPGQDYKSYADTWEDVRTQLKEEDKFSKHLQIITPFAEKLDSIDFKSMTVTEKVRCVYKILKSNMKWNQKLGLYFSDDIVTVLRKGEGSNAQLNFILLAMLKHVNVKCTPMLVKPRKYGPISAPTLGDLSSFIIAFADEKQNVYFIDSSSDYGDINALNPDLMGYGVLYDPTIVDNPENVYSIFNIGGNVSSIDIRGLISDEGEIHAQLKNTCHGMISLSKMSHYFSADSTQYVESLEKLRDINVKQFSFVNLDKEGSQCRESYSFTKSLGMTEGRLYVNPIVFPDEFKNHFTSETRINPIEFPYSQSTTITSRLTVPNSYEIEEMPKNKSISTLDGSLEASISFKVVNDFIVTTYKFRCNSTFVSPDKYDWIRKFWSELLGMNNQTVVLKKK